MAVKIKIKNTTNEIVTEVARRLGVKNSDITNEFHMYWLDVNYMMNHYAGYGFYIRNFGHLLLNVSNADKIAKSIEVKINKRLRYISYVNRQVVENNVSPGTRITKSVSDVAEYITSIILLSYSIQLYNSDVLSVYPKKYKPKDTYLKEYITRLEKHFNISLSAFPIQINHPLQEVFVRKLQQKGILSNPVVYKNKEV